MGGRSQLALAPPGVWLQQHCITSSPCALHMFYKCIQLPSVGEEGSHRGGTAEQHPSSLTSTRHTSPSPAVLAYKSHRKHSDFSRMIFVPSVLGNAAICGFRSYLKEGGRQEKNNKATIYPNTEAHKTDKTRKLKKYNRQTLTRPQCCA